MAAQASGAHVRLVAVLAAAVLVAGLMTATSTVEAVHNPTYTVDSFADEPNAAPTSEICDTGTGDCTLRAAVMAANAHVGHATIQLEDGTYTLTISGDDPSFDDFLNNTINPEAEAPFTWAAQGDLDVLRPLTIEGSGATVITTDWDTTVHRIFDVHATMPADIDTWYDRWEDDYRSGTNGADERTCKTSPGTGEQGIIQTNLTLSGVTLEGGTATASEEERGGGAIAFHGTASMIDPDDFFDELDCRPTGTLSVSNSILRDNVATSSGGGAIALDGAGWRPGDPAGGATLNLSGASFIGNETTQSNTSGGAVEARTNAVTLSNSMFEENDANGSGGALSFRGRTLTVSNTDFHDNFADGEGSGGALDVVMRAPDSGNRHTTFTVTGGSFTDNRTWRSGGAISLRAQEIADPAVSATSLVSGVTFSGNRAGFNRSDSNPCCDGAGGAIRALYPDHEVPLDGLHAASATLRTPAGLAVDAAGNVLLAEESGHSVRRVSASNQTITRIAGTGSSGYSGDGQPATAAQLNSPRGLAVDGDGNLFIADRSNHRVRRVDAGTGVITTVAGSGSCCTLGDGGQATDAWLSSPRDVALDGDGNLYIADTNNSRVRRVDAGTGVITTVAGSGSCCTLGDGGLATDAWLSGPRGVALDGDGNLYIADSGNHRVRRVDEGTGVITTVAGTGCCGGFSGDGGLATSAQLNSPRDVALDGDGNLYIADTNNHRVRRVDEGTGVITTVAGTGCCGFSGDGGLATDAQLHQPHDVALDASGNLFVADTGTCCFSSSGQRIRRVDAGTGIITTYAGGGDLWPKHTAFADPTGLLDIRNSTFAENEANEAGGQVWQLGGRLEVRGSTFNGRSDAGERVDSAGEGGGAVWAGHTVVDIRTTTFSGHQAKQSGGALWLLGRPATLTSVTLDDNASGRTTDGGGAIHAGESSLTANGLVVRNNTAEGEGGGLMAVGGSGVALTGGSFENNRARHAGGGIRLASSTLSMSNVTVTGNRAGYELNGDVVTVSESGFGLMPAGRGGGLAVTGFGDKLPQGVVITGGSFHSNHASLNGGGLFVMGGYVGDAKNLRMTKVSVRDNRAGFDGDGDPIAGVEACETHPDCAFGSGGGVFTKLAHLLDTNVSGNTAAFGEAQIHCDEGRSTDAEDERCDLTIATSPPPAPSEPEPEPLPSVEEEAEAGETVSTLPEGGQVTEASPVAASVTTPNAGTVSITVDYDAEDAQDGFTMLGVSVDIDAPPATAADPLVLTFYLDESLLDGVDPMAVTPLRDGVPVADCSDPAGTSAAPDPCVASRTIDANGDLVIVVRTSQASLWTFGVADAQPGHPDFDAECPPSGFGDVDAGNVHAGAIDCAAAYGIARGFEDGTYRAALGVRRDQMASFIVRTLESGGHTVPDGSPGFTDVAGNVHAEAIGKLREAGIVEGVGGGRYAPERVVSRAQMASFLTRALDWAGVHVPDSAGGYFTDIDGNTHEAAINAAFELGLTTGRTATTYEPAGDVRRDQMASFLMRMHGHL